MKAPFGSKILSTMARIMVPFILLFGAYVVLHGHYSPGGGFQGGTIFAVGFILLRLIGGPVARCGPGLNSAKLMAALGMTLFAIIGLLPLLLGYAYLDYAAYWPGHVEARSWGILGIELGVALAVTGVLILIYELLVNVAEH